jgi:hypothetical protein
LRRYWGICLGIARFRSSPGQELWQVCHVSRPIR